MKDKDLEELEKNVEVRYITDCYGKRRKIYKHSRNTRISCISQIRTAQIIFDNAVIGTISEEMNDAGETDWVFKMDWDAWKKHKTAVPGIDLDLRLDEYIRTYVPSFVEKRVIPDGRENKEEELARIGLTYNDPFEVMCRFRGICGNDKITVKRLSEVLVNYNTGETTDIMERPTWEDRHVFNCGKYDEIEYKGTDFHFVDKDQYGVYLKEGDSVNCFRANKKTEDGIIKELMLDDKIKVEFKDNVVEVIKASSTRKNH